MRTGVSQEPQRLLERVSRELTAIFGNGFGEPHLRNCRLFYRVYPSEEEIRYALRIKLSWTHHRAIMRVADRNARMWYLQEASLQGWDTRKLERQIRLRAYDRLLVKPIPGDAPEESVKTMAEPSPATLLKDPCVAEFLDLRENLRGKEKKVEKRILDNIEKFMLELGRGFTLAGRQYRVPTETSERRIDLVFYNYILKCFVLIDLKTSKITHQDVGQMDMYVRMYDELKRGEGDNPTLGIVLCSDTDSDIARYSVLHGNEQLFASKYRLCLPKEDELRAEIETQKRIFEEQMSER